MSSCEETLKTVTKSTHAWHALIILSSISHSVSQTLSEEFLDEICLNIKFIIVGAYDAEGYIFWQKLIEKNN